MSRVDCSGGGLGDGRRNGQWEVSSLGTGGGPGTDGGSAGVIDVCWEGIKGGRSVWSWEVSKTACCQLPSVHLPHLLLSTSFCCGSCGAGSRMSLLLPWSGRCHFCVSCLRPGVSPGQYPTPHWRTSFSLPLCSSVPAIKTDPVTRRRWMWLCRCLLMSWLWIHHPLKHPWSLTFIGWFVNVCIWKFCTEPSHGLEVSL